MKNKYIDIKETINLFKVSKKSKLFDTLHWESKHINKN